MLNYPINVTIDTNVLYATNYDFSENSPLSLLVKYVQKGKIKVILSDIVIREAKAHISKQVSDVCGTARRLRKEVLEKSTQSLVDYIGMGKLLELVNDKNNLVLKGCEMFDNFIIQTGAEILKTDLIDLDNIIDDYFEINPPFQNGEKKRKEFPDAFIACQIRKRFGETEDVIIISNDNGFKAACGNNSNHIFLSSLGQLYNTINKEEKAYDDTINLIKELQFRIRTEIFEFIKTNESIDVRGLSYDKDGIVSGYDYDEFYLQDISNGTFVVHSVDEISEKTSIITLSCKAKMSVDCYYEDYENAPWDSEAKEYVFVESIKMREEHDARFACQIQLNRETKDFKISPFKVILGGDSRKEVYEIKDEETENCKRDICNMDRETLGFNALGSYESYLEEALPESGFSKRIIEQFQIINSFRNQYEEISIDYYELFEKINKDDNLKEICGALYKKLKECNGFPTIINEEHISDDELTKIKKWFETAGETTCEISKEGHLPDYISYGDTILIKGIDDELTLSIQDISNIDPSAGEQESIDVLLSKAQETIATGSITLTVGYLDFDEDGGAANGIEDNIEYECHEIIKKIDGFILKQKEKVEEYLKVSEILKEFLDTDIMN